MTGIFNRQVSLMDAGVLRGGSDSHSHILFGVDDGIRTSEESLRAISMEEAVGVNEIWCTPHIMEDIPNTTEDLKTRFRELKSSYGGKIHLYLAAEYMIDTLFDERLEKDDLLTMKGDTVLVETSVWTPPMDMKRKLDMLRRNGYKPLLAHPERYFYMGKTDYIRLRDMFIGFQLNLPSLAGYYGRDIREKAAWLLKNGMYIAFGTDCHRADSLPGLFSEKFLSKDQAERLVDISNKM